MHSVLYVLVVAVFSHLLSIDCTLGHGYIYKWLCIVVEPVSAAEDISFDKSS